jgi:zinc protease
MTPSRVVRSHIILWSAAIAAATACMAGAAEPVQWTLENGLKACVVEDYGAEAAAVAITIRATADCEPASKAGLRSVLQHAIRFGWDKRIETDEDLAFLLDMNDVGGGLSISTDWEYIGFSYVGMPDTVAQALAFMAAGTYEPELNEETHKAGADLVRGAILGTQTGPADSTISLFLEAMLGNASRAYPLGTLETIDEISVADLIAFHRRYYVIAPLPAAEMRAMVEREFGALPAGKATLPPPPDLMPLPDSRVATNPELLLGGPDQLGVASIVVGVPAPGCWDEDLPVSYVIHGLLGGNGSAKGRIDEDDELWAALGLPFPLEESRRNQFIQSIPPPLSARSHLAIHAYASPRRVEDVRRAIVSEFERLADEAPTDDELQRAKDYVRNAYAVLFDMHAARALMASRGVALGLPDPLPPVFGEQLARVTARDVKRVARRYFSKHAVGVEFPEAQD